MKITAHQPEHFPYMGFFQKMKAADVFVILDDVQYTKGNFQNRNKFQNKNKDEEWFTISLEKKAHHKLIKDVKTNDTFNWRERIVKQLFTNFNIDFSNIYSNSNLVDINLIFDLSPLSLSFNKSFLSVTNLPAVPGSESDNVKSSSF